LDVCSKFVGYRTIITVFDCCCILLFEDNHHWISWFIEDVLKMHGVICELLSFNGLVKAKVVMSFLQSIEIDIPVKCTHRVRVSFHIHLKIF
jgi:hypothetical protein